ncbi:MAG: cysteine desulfurase [Verrucomicrobiaceae bacterium]|nr:MAG: cysteine desulfurase [Verrucomicrobiaceae bacterium]
MVYLDYNATTPLCLEAKEAMLPFLDGIYGNPSSIHSEGRRARAEVDEARDRVAAVMGVRPHEIIFTGGGTESCNLGIIGLARAHAPKGRHIITSSIEHHAVLHAFEYLKHFEGFEVEILPVERNGIVSPDRLAAMIHPDTTLVSVMHANNETGAIQPLRELSEICRDHGVLLHTDAVQTFGKIPMKPADLGVSALSISSHKFYGPKGVGALFLAAGVALSRTVHGGAQENTRRPGTENVAGIAGMAAAAEMTFSQAPLLPLREQLWDGILDACPTALRNGDAEHSLANTLNVSFPGMDGEALLIGLDLEGVCASSGSACMVGSIRPSHVLLAMGLPPATAMATVRFSLGRETTANDISHAISAVHNVAANQLLPA